MKQTGWTIVTVLLGFPINSLKTLQLILNTAAHILTRTRSVHSHAGLLVFPRVYFPLEPSSTFVAGINTLSAFNSRLKTLCCELKLFNEM